MGLGIGLGIGVSAKGTSGPSGPAFVDLTLDNYDVDEDQGGLNTVVGNIIGGLGTVGPITYAIRVIAQEEANWFWSEEGTAVSTSDGGAVLDFETNPSPQITLREYDDSEPDFMNPVGPYHDTVIEITVNDVAEVLDTGWVSPTTGADIVVGAGNAWSDPGNVAASDDTYASVVSTTAGTHCHRSGGFDFSAIPVGATITKVEVEVEIKKSGGTAVLTETYLTDGATSTTADRITTDQTSSSLAIGTSDAYVAIVPSTDLWGLGAALTRAVVQSANFGFEFRCSNSFSSSTVTADHVHMKVYYTP